MRSAIRRYVLVLASAFLFAAAASAYALWDIANGGDWPTSWPSALEPMRAKSITGIHDQSERFYELPFETKEDFDKAWPHLLAIMGQGGHITFLESNATHRPTGVSLPAGVVVLAPSEAYAKPGATATTGAAGQPTEAEIGAFDGGKAGVILKAGEPWPDTLRQADVELPEFVRADRIGGLARWVDARLSPTGGAPLKDALVYRCRVDLVVWVDNKVIDWRKLDLPKDKVYIFERISPTPEKPAI